VTARRVTGILLVALMIVHPFLRPERGWVLLSACDVAALATALGLIVPSDRVLAAAFLFQVMIGLPSLTIGIATGVYPINPTGIAIHVVPPILAASWLRTLPPRTSVLAWIGSLGAFFATMAFAPAVLNLNFSDRVWTPLQGTFSSSLEFDVALFAAAAVLLGLGEPLWRRVLGRRA
jgi:hypothetical protein